MFRKQTFQILVCIALVLAAVGLFTPRELGEPLSPFAYQTNFYLTDGGDKAVAASGGEIEMLSGSTLDVQDGVTAAIYDLTVNDTLNVDGDIDLDGDGFDVNITAGFSIDADAGSNISLSSGDVLVDAEAGSVTIIGSEADASAIHLDANDTVTSGINVDVGSVSGLAIDGGLTDFGTGTYATADGDGDVGIEGDLEINTGLDLDGATFDVDITGGASIDADLASNFSAAAGDITIDAEAGSVNIIGSEAANNSVYIDANDTVTSGIDIDTGTTSGLTVDGGPFSVDGTGAFNINTASGDITVEAETGSVTIKGDEEVADAIHLDANATITQGIDIDVGSVHGLAIDGGLTDFGTGTYATADGDNDVGIEGDLEINTGFDLDGATFDADITGGASIDADQASNFTTSAGDLTLLADTGSVVIKGDEAVADAIYLDANDAITTGITAIVGTAGTFGVTGYIADFDMTGGISLDANLASNFNTAAGDITVEAETGSVIIKGDEEVADAILLNAATTITQGIDINVGSVHGLSIDGGLTNFGTGTYAIADGDNDVGVEGVMEVNGVAYLDGGAEVNGTLTLENDETIVNSSDGIITFTMTTADFVGSVNVTTDLDVNGTTNLDVTDIDGAVDMASTLAVGGDITLENDETINNSADGYIGFGGGVLFSGTTITVTDGLTITPTIYSGYRLNAAGEVTITLAVCSQDWQPLFLFGEDNVTINIADTNIRTNDGNAQTLGQYGLITWMCIDSEWVELSESDNS